MQSENSRGKSASGDADSPCSLNENITSRKTMDFVPLTGPFGDHFLLEEISPTEMLFKAQASNSSTDSEDSDLDVLKMEYLQRLALIKGQIAKSDYYANCFDYPYFPNQCTLTELHDSPNKTNNCSPKATAIEIKDNNSDAEENNENDSLIENYNFEDYENMNLNATEEKSNSDDSPNKTNHCSPKETAIEINDNRDAEDNKENDSLIEDYNLEECKTLILNATEEITNSYDSKTNNSSPIAAIEIKNNKKDAGDNNENYSLIEDYNLEDCKTNLNATKEKTNSNETAKQVSEVEIKNLISSENYLKSIQENLIKESAKPLPNLEMKGIQSFENDLNATEESTNSNDVLIQESARELSELEIKSVLSFDNVYNSESSLELMELHYNPPKKKPCIRDSTPRMYKFDSALKMPENNLFKFKNEFKDSQEEKNIHIFPKVKIECTCGIKPVETIDVSCGQSEYDDLENISPNSTNLDYLYVKYLDSTENSPSSRSYQSNITEATTTIESPQKKSKKRRLFLRSASNKVKPIDKITLWEEIRTMEAMKKKNIPKASSSQESIFKKILIRKPKTIQNIDLKAIGSLDIPRKSSISGRFPSITKITKFCSSIFTKKSATVVEDLSEAKKVSKTVQTGNSHKAPHHNKELVPKVAKALMDVRKEQRISLESHTPSYEEHSEYSYQEDDVETYFQQYCIFCFCF